MQLKGLRLDDELSFDFVGERWFGERGKQVRNLIKENNDFKKNHDLFEQSSQF